MSQPFDVAQDKPFGFPRLLGVYQIHTSGPPLFFLFNFCFLIFSICMILSRRLTRETLNSQNELPSRKKSIEGLAPLSHAFHFDPCGNMSQIDTGRGLIDLLPSSPR